VPPASKAPGHSARLGTLSALKGTREATCREATRRILPDQAAACDVREARYGKPSYAPTGAPDPDTGALPPLAPKTFYLESVDELHRRQYGRTPE